VAGRRAITRSGTTNLRRRVGTFICAKIPSPRCLMRYIFWRCSRSFLFFAWRVMLDVLCCVCVCIALALHQPVRARSVTARAGLHARPPRALSRARHERREHGNFDGPSVSPHRRRPRRHDWRQGNTQTPNFLVRECGFKHWVLPAKRERGECVCGCFNAADLLAAASKHCFLT
jgi:hypothetical protein